MAFRRKVLDRRVDRVKNRVSPRVSRRTFRRAAGCVRARRLPGPTVLAAPLAIAALAATAFFDCSLLRVDVLVIAGAILAVSAKSFPKEKIRGNG